MRGYAKGTLCNAGDTEGPPLLSCFLDLVGTLDDPRNA